MTPSIMEQYFTFAYSSFAEGSFISPASTTYHFHKG